MKKRYILLLVFVFGNTVLWAQTQKGFNYQTVIRNSDGVVLNNTNVGIRISILQESFTGPIVYKEQFAETTNQIGLINLVVGSGTVISGVYNSINWSLTNYFLKVELDANNTGTYIEIGTSQLVSVPYANFAFSGNPGESAYETWLKNGNTGNEEVFLDSLQGGKGGPGILGESAYENWLNNGNTGSEKVFMDSLQGSTGALGVSGESTYEGWLKKGNIGTKKDFIDANQGKQGKQGISAYEVWLSLGNTGTESDFIKSLTGPAGKSSWKDTLSNVVTNKKVGIGSKNPDAQFEIKAPLNRSADSALFEVKNSIGKTVFAVYENEVQVYLDKANNSGFTIDKVDDNNIVEELVAITPAQASFYVDSSSTKAARGGFAVSGRTSNKAEPIDILNITTGLTEVFVDEATTKAARGGFAVSGRTSNKGAYDIMSLTLDSTRFYIGNESGKAARGGFAVSGRTSNKGLSEEILKVTPGLAEVFVSESAAKSARGGFAVSGRTSNKSVETFDILHVQPKSTDIYIKNDPASKELPKGFSISGYDSEFTPVELFNVTELGTVITTPLAIAPEVTSYEPEFITQNTASSGGSVTDSNNVAITEVGIIYNQLGLLDLDIDFTDPSVSGKIVGDLTSASDFKGLLMENLLPGQTYQVRAYASNLEGLTGYGEIKNFTTYTNSPKSVSFTVKDDGGNPLKNILITIVKGTIIADTTKTDANGEGIALLQTGEYSYQISSFGFYESTGNLTVTSDALQTFTVTPLVPLPKYSGQFWVYDPNYEPVYNATVYLYDIGGNFMDSANTDINGVAYFYDVPEWEYAYQAKFNQYKSTGSIFVDTYFYEYIYFEEPPFEYKEVISITGRTWLDRNLGAFQVATNSTDALAYGDLYQWGRATDGHQSRTSSATGMLSNSDSPGHGEYIISPDNQEDWRTTPNANLWQGVNGVNNPCPPNFRIPTTVELTEEINSWSSMDAIGAMNSPLKLTLGGYRDNTQGNLTEVNDIVGYWSSSVIDNISAALVISSQSAQISDAPRALGLSVRCIKNGGSIGTTAFISADTLMYVDATTATLRANIDSVGGTSITEMGVVYLRFSGVSLGINDGRVLVDPKTGMFTASLTGLKPSTQYFAKAYAINQAGVAYGKELMFVTDTLGMFEVYSPNTNRIWMDRNLGASQVATSKTDAAAYGDLYQWGRLADGHQLRTSTSTNTLSDGDVPLTNDFIVPTTWPYNWRSTENPNLWQGVNGINNPCPNGFRVPTWAEFENERVANWMLSPWDDNAFNSPLKITLNGWRNAETGVVEEEGIVGQYWISDSTYIFGFRLGLSDFVGNQYAATGATVRCIKEDAFAVITTTGVSNIEATQAKISGVVNNEGKSTVFDRGVIYSSVNTNPTFNDYEGFTQAYIGAGPFSTNILWLTPLTTYYVRTYASNNDGTAYGNVISFKTGTQVVEVFNSTTGRTWMDRNLGASHVADSSADVNSYGDLYQWGRLADGHELRTSADTTLLSFTDIPGHSHFILSNSGDYDWRNPQNDSLWQGVNGISNPCPKGFRIPSYDELNDELATWNSPDINGAFTSILQLPAAGNRLGIDGSIINEGSQGFYMSSLTSAPNIYALWVSSGNALMMTRVRTMGQSVRCIKGLEPQVSTSAVTYLTSSSAQVEGTVESEGESPVTERGVVYGTNPNPIYGTDLSVSDGIPGSGNFAIGIGGLASFTSYYVRTYAISAIGTVYGNELSFVTVTEVVEVTSALGRIWMDRNLGATQAATNITDSTAFGDLYQWGRGSDGHEKIYSGATSILSSSDQPGHPDFITSSIGNYDWRDPQNDNLWQGKNGVNNPCPEGFRIPTIDEFLDEISSWGSQNDSGAFASPLKLIMPGYRQSYDAVIVDIATQGNYWSSTVNGSISGAMNINSASAATSSADRANGFSVRCIKEYLPTVTTGVIDSITQTTAYISGEVVEEGPSEVTERGFVYSIYPNNSLTSDYKTMVGSGWGIFSTALTGFTSGSTYYIRAYAINAQGVSYGVEKQFNLLAIDEVYSPATGRVWKDKNLGASQVATSMDDVNAYGDLYQWGRGADGHQLRTSTTTGVLSSFDNPEHPDFITSSSGNLDWRDPQNDSLWNNLVGVNNPCPVGFRIPTNQEFEYEKSSWATADVAGAYNSPLKLTTAGYRINSVGSIFHDGVNGYYWTNSVDNVYGRYLYFSDAPAQAMMLSDVRAKGFSVRCIMDQLPIISTDATNPTSSSSVEANATVLSQGQSTVTAAGFVYSTSPNPTVELNEGITMNHVGGGGFSGSLTGLIESSTYYIRAYATNSYGTSYGNEEIFNFLTIGYSYQGGIIAYILKPGDAGYDPGVTHGLIAAPSDQSASAGWGCYTSEISGADGTAIGTGNQNTIDIMAGCGTAGTAAQLCNDLVIDIYNDWYLPSRDELSKLYDNKAVVGGLVGNAYWSSTELDQFDAIYIDFNLGSAGNINKVAGYYVRAVRSF